MIILITVPTFVNVNAKPKEKLIYMTDYVDGGGILESQSIIDPDGNLHIFLHLESAEGNRFIHLFSINGITDMIIINDRAQGVNIRFVFQVGVIYSEITEGGEMIFYKYHWVGDIHHTDQIFVLNRHIVLYGITFYDFSEINGMIHIFHNLYYGEDGQFMNITHFVGHKYSPQEFQSETIYISNDNWKNLMDIVIDKNQKVWCIYRLYQEDFGFGIGKLDNTSFVPVVQRSFSALQSYVEKIVAQPDDDELVNIVFLNPNKIIWNSFNGTRISYDIQTTFYTNPIDFEYHEESGESTILLADKPEENDFVSLYLGKYQDDSWSFSIIQSNIQIRENHYSSYFYDENYVILYDATVTPSEHSSIGTSYREKNAIAVFSLSNLSLSFEALIENLTSFNPIIEYLQTRWYVALIAGLAFIALILLALLIWKRNKTKIKGFLTDKQVGDFSIFILIFLNIGRWMYNVLHTVFTIWFSNKKRTIFTLTGFVITGYLLSSAIIIAQSEESAMINAYERTFSLISDKEITGSIQTTFLYTSEEVNINPDYAKNAKDEILQLYNNTLFKKYITGIETSYWTSIYLNDSSLPYSFAALPDNAEEFINNTLFEGRLPQNDSEILVSGRFSSLFDIELNDTITLIGSNSKLYSGEEQYYFNATVVGIYADLTVSQIRRLSKYFSI